jgi:hypothetical protein
MVVFGVHAACRHLVDLVLGHLGNRSAAPDQRLEPLHFLELDGGHEIPGGSAMAGHGDRLALGDFPILTKVPGKFGSWDSAHGASPLIAQFTHFVGFVKDQAI